MGGIGGLFRFDGLEVAREDLKHMQEVLYHRGHDGSKIWVDGSCGLLQLCLKVESELFVRDGLALVLDGRIDNIDALSHRIGMEGASLSLHEILLEAFRFLKDKVPGFLLGDFALAVWDQSQKRLLVARDPIGVKPLYYSVQRGRFIFASEVKGILTLNGVSCGPDPVRVMEFEDFRFRSAERTFFEGIHRLKAGEMIVVDGSGIRRQRFWSPDPDQKIRFLSREGYIKKFRELFLEAVRCRLPQSGTVAFTLSGGVDSSSVIAAAYQIQKEERPDLKLHAISFLSRHFPDEREYIKTVCEHFRISHTVLYVEDLNPLDGLSEALWYEDGPFYDMVDADYIKLYEIARSIGARVVLSGGWGDQVLSGMAYLGDLLQEGSWLGFCKELKRLPENDGGSVRRILKRVIWYLLLPNNIQDRYGAMGYLARRVLLPFKKTNESGPKFPLASQRELYDEVFSTHKQMLLECVDRGAAREGVEVRFPFLDRRLFEFLLAIPSEERIREGLGKRILRESLSDLLPEVIAKRNSKGDYTEIFYERLKDIGFLAPSPAESDRLWRENTLRVWKEVRFKNGKEKDKEEILQEASHH